MEQLTPSNAETQSITEAMVCMLHICINHKVMLELPLMQTITSKYGLGDGNSNWDILSDIIRLDARALIASHSEPLLKDLFSHIARANLEISWPSVAGTVIDNVLVPLMQEIFKERQGPTFFVYWLEQLLLFEKAPNKLKMVRISAWEDEAVFLNLRNLLEASLTSNQILLCATKCHIRCHISNKYSYSSKAQSL